VNESDQGGGKRSLRLFDKPGPCVVVFPPPKEKKSAGKLGREEHVSRELDQEKENTGSEKRERKKE